MRPGSHRPRCTLARNNRSPQYIAKILAVAMLPASSAMAIDYSWVGGSGTWDVASNWTPSGIPGESDNALLVQNGSIDQTITYRRTGSPMPRLALLRIDELGSGHTMLSQDQDELLANIQSVGFEGTGVFTQSGGTSNTGSLILGGEPGGSALGAGTYNLSGSGMLNVFIAHVGASGPGTFHQSGGAVTVSGTMHVNTSGNTGGALYRHTAGLLSVPQGSLRIGSSTFSVGTYRLEDGLLHSGYVTLVGTSGLGEFVQTGGIHHATAVEIGHAFNPGSGSYTLSGGTITTNFLGIAENGQFTMEGGSLAVATVFNNGTFTQTAGTASVGRIVNQPWGSGTLLIGGSSRLAVDSYEQSFVSISAGGRLTVRAGGTASANQTNLLAISPGAALDLNDHALIVDYSIASPLAAIREQIAAGYADGAWTGPGITSSSAAAEPGYGLGYAQSTEVFGRFPATFEGRSVDASAVVVHYTRSGDATLDGIVNLADFNRLAANYGRGEVWSEGDFNYDALVNLADFNLLAANFGLSAGPDGVVDPEDWSTLATAIPEPTTLFGGVAASAPMFLRRIRRKPLQ